MRLPLNFDNSAALTVGLAVRAGWHRLRGHNVRDLGYPCGNHRVWCYDCAKDLIPWVGHPSLEELLEQARAEREANTR